MQLIQKRSVMCDQKQSTLVTIHCDLRDLRIEDLLNPHSFWSWRFLIIPSLIILEAWIYNVPSDFKNRPIQKQIPLVLQANSLKATDLQLGSWDLLVLTSLQWQVFNKSFTKWTEILQKSADFCPTFSKVGGKPSLCSRIHVIGGFIQQ